MPASLMIRLLPLLLALGSPAALGQSAAAEQASEPDPAASTPPADPSADAGVPVDDDDDFFVFDENEAEPQPSIADPLERFNRVMFTVNDKLYRGVLKPVARVYRVVPRPVRVSIGNFFDNLGRPVSAINALLQFDLPNTGTELGRFAVNSTVGLLGFFDPATGWGLEKDDEDLGQTFARWGIGHGVYLVVPGRGPSSLRDATGGVGNAFMNPVYQNVDDEVAIGMALWSATNSLSLDQDTYEALYDRAIDPYIFFRSAYVQNRGGQVAK